MDHHPQERLLKLKRRLTWRELLANRWYILLALPILAFLLSFPIGKYPISIPDMLHTIYYHFAESSQIINGNMETTIFNIRLPRILSALLIGGGLSIAGASYQGMFKNPMVSPDVLGATAGAAFGACVAMLLDAPTLVVQLSSFFGELLSVALASGLTKKLSRDPLMGLVLGGIMVSTLCQSGTSAVKLLADADNQLPQITFWLMGGLNKINFQDFISILIPMGIGFVLLFCTRWQLNVLSFGEEEARSLGVKTARVRTLIIIASTLITAATVSVCGMIGWVGLVIPHMCRALVGANYRSLIPACVVVGSTFLLLVDDIARCAFAVELPIGILTSFIGVPFFFVILRRDSKKGEFH